MKKIFKIEQIQKFKEWKRFLKTKKALRWDKEEKEAEVKINNILKTKNFQNGGPLSESDLDEIFRLMKAFSTNPILGKNLYELNTLKKFSDKLRDLYYGNRELPDRVQDFLSLKNVKVFTLSHFLYAFDSKQYPLLSRFSRPYFGLNKDQEDLALDLALDRFKIKPIFKYTYHTRKYLKDVIIYEELKELLNLDNYRQLNDLFWLAYEKKEEIPKILKMGFEIEKHLEDFIEHNWSNIDWGSNLELYTIGDQTGRQFKAGKWKIDFLAIDVDTNDLVVIELKRDKPSSKVLEQVLKYIAWVKKYIATGSQKVRGIIIANRGDRDLKLALTTLDHVEIRLFEINFSLQPY